MVTTSEILKRPLMSHPPNKNRPEPFDLARGGKNPWYHPNFPDGTLEPLTRGTTGPTSRSASRLRDHFAALRYGPFTKRAALCKTEENGYSFPSKPFTRDSIGDKLGFVKGENVQGLNQRNTNSAGVMISGCSTPDSRKSLSPVRRISARASIAARRMGRSL